MGRKRGSMAVAALAAAAICVLGLMSPPSLGGGQWTPMKVTLLKVGKADAIVVQNGDKTLVIDAGEEEDGEELVTFLNHQDIDRVDALIVTHYDRDHVGGADTLVETMPVDRVLLPAYQGTHTEYADFMRALEAKGVQPELLKEPAEFDLQDAHVRVEPPLSYETPGGNAEMDNNFSLITTITHGEKRLLFTGDAEKQRIREWLDSGAAMDCDFLKVPHHGVYNTALKALVEAVSPEQAVICTSRKNPAEARTLEVLKQHNIDVLQTKDGDITLISDGSRLELHQRLEH